MTDYITDLLLMLLALAIVIALALLILKGVKSIHAQGNKDNLLKIKLSLAIGSRERIMVLNYEDTDYVLGITPNNISLIDKKTVSLEATGVDSDRYSPQKTSPPN